MSFTDAFKLSFYDEFIGKLYDEMNERVAQFFPDNAENKGRVNSITWHPVTHDHVYIFCSYHGNDLDRQRKAF